MMEQRLPSGRISDPVHGLIDFTAIERQILNHRSVQRLRYIFQSGLAHLVFPEVRTSRFSHSLGAMHLTSRILASSLRNADESTKETICKAIRGVVRKEVGYVVSLKVAAEGLSSDVLLAHNYCRAEYRSELLLVEQALRLAALFHDLGHLPFSHDFETALEEAYHNLPETEQRQSPLRTLLEFEDGVTAIHEQLGHHLALLLLQDLLRSVDSGYRSSVEKSFNLAIKILISSEEINPNPETAITYWLHSLIDGEVDADRADYLLRDGRNYGFEFATYNLGRLLDNLVAVARDNTFSIAVGPRGIATVESFFLSHYRSYQNGVRHHKVAQIGAALRHSILRMLENTHGTDVDEFVKLLERIVSADSDNITDDERQILLYKFAKYDDIWWMSKMRELSDQGSDEWLDLACWRKPGPRSLWKRVSDFPVDIKEWNAKLPDRTDAEGQQKWLNAVSTLRKQGVLITRYRRSPWKPITESDDPNFGESRLSVLMPNTDLVPVSRLSPLVRALQDAWQEDIQVQAFARSDSPISAVEVVNTLIQP